MNSRVLSFVLLSNLISGAVLAQSSGSASTLDAVIVTGTRVSDRTIVESQSPIDIITPETLAATGALELATALSRALPSLNFPRVPALASGGDAASRSAQLRGMSPDQLLVLVNGKRRHLSSLLHLNNAVGRGTTSVDLNSIPVSAIERVEVLRDGAAAQYGSDAIAGVVNIVLKGRREGGHLDLTGGQYSAGDGAQWQLSGDVGVALRQNRGFLHLSAEVGAQDHTNRAGPYIGPPSPTQPPPGRKVMTIGEPEFDSVAVSANTEFALTNHIDMYGFGMVNNREFITTGFFRAAGDPARNVSAIYPDGFRPTPRILSRDRSIVAGIKGSHEHWNWDVSYNYGFNRMEFYVSTTLNASLGPSSPNSFYSGAMEATQNIVNADISRLLDWELTYPATFSFGFEARNEKWNQSPGEYNSYVNAGLGAPNAGTGAQGFLGYPPDVSGAYDRDSYAVYAGLELDVTERFSGGIAARWEDFDDFGRQASGKISARYAFTDAVALRGTVSSGFRAPSLAQQYFQTVNILIIAPDPNPFEIRTFPSSSPIARDFGADPLKQETSLSYSLGLVLQPTRKLYVTVDAYQIEVDDRIELSSNMVSPGVRTRLEAQGIFGVSGVRYFTNAIDTRTRGVDVVGTWTTELPGGSTLNLTGSYNHTRTEITRIAPNPPQLESSGLNLERIDRADIGRIERGYPHNKIMLGAVWDIYDWKFSATNTRYGSVTTTPNVVEITQTFGGKWLLDVSANYSPGDHWQFTLGADNILNEYPDRRMFASSFGGQFPYPDDYSPFGFNGAFVYAKIGYKW